MFEIKRRKSEVLNFSKSFFKNLGIINELFLFSEIPRQSSIVKKKPFTIAFLTSEHPEDFVKKKCDSPKTSLQTDKFEPGCPYRCSLNQGFFLKKIFYNHSLPVLWLVGRNFGDCSESSILVICSRRSRYDIFTIYIWYSNAVTN